MSNSNLTNIINFTKGINQVQFSFSFFYWLQKKRAKQVLKSTDLLYLQQNEIKTEEKERNLEILFVVFVVE